MNFRLWQMAMVVSVVTMGWFGCYGEPQPADSSLSQISPKEDDTMPIYRNTFIRPYRFGQQFEAQFDYGFLLIIGQNATYDLNTPTGARNGLNGQLSIQGNNQIITNLGGNPARLIIEDPLDPSVARGTYNFANFSPTGVFRSADINVSILDASVPVVIPTITALRVRDPLVSIVGANAGNLTSPRIRSILADGTIEAVKGFVGPSFTVPTSTTAFLVLDAFSMNRAVPHLAGGPVAVATGWQGGVAGDSLIASLQLPIGQTVSKVEFNIDGDVVVNGTCAIAQRNPTTGALISAFSQPSTLVAGNQVLTVTPNYTQTVGVSTFLQMVLPGTAAPTLMLHSIVLYP